MIKGDKKIVLNIETDSLDKVITKKESELDTLLKEFAEKHVVYQVDKAGNEINATNPYLVSTYFFKPINPLENVEPIYTSEQLSKVYEYYSYVIEKINLEIMPFQPTIAHFCKFAGITVQKFNELKNSPNETMRILIEKINRDTYDANMLMAQHRKLAERSTIFRMKSENEVTEKTKPNVSIKMDASDIDISSINSKLREVRAIVNKQRMYEGK